MAYDKDNIFARILRQEIPAEKVYEDEYVLAFHDIGKLAPVHVLVIPRKPLESLRAADPTDAELLGHLLLVAAR